jgi:hypothetical protein
MPILAATKIKFAVPRARNIAKFRGFCPSFVQENLAGRLGNTSMEEGSLVDPSSWAFENT